MRLAGTVKNGFYPAAPEAISALMKHLRCPPDPPPSGDHAIHILDPCAGEGQALVDIYQGLSLSAQVPPVAYAVELNASRAERVRQLDPRIRLLGPCSFHAARISRHAFSCIYCNPPFDDEFGGGGREELSFVRRSMELLALGGVFVLVCPFNQVLGKPEMLSALDTYLERTELFLFPDGHRPYREAVVIGVRRQSPLPDRLLYDKGVLLGRGYRYCWAREESQLPAFPRLGTPTYERWDRNGEPVELSRRSDLDVWTVPYTWGPRQFDKTDLTAEEIEFELARSPLYKRLRTRQYKPIGRPPMPLNAGHTSLLLLTGLLDGYVPSDPPHVVRGYCGKDKRLSRVESYTTPGGSHVEKRVTSEQPNPVCRAVWADGNIQTFSQKAPDVAEPIEVDQAEKMEDEDE